MSSIYPASDITVRMCIKMAVSTAAHCSSDMHQCSLSGPWL